MESSRKCNQRETMRNATQNNSYKEQRMEREYLEKECFVHTSRTVVLSI